jgi:hypothetical protein
MSTTAERRSPGEPVTEEEAAVLRAQIPDHPVKLPAGQLACDCCGVGVVVTSKKEVVVAQVPKHWGHQRPEPVGLVRCPSCRSVVEEATSYLAQHPEHERRMGNVAQERVEQALFALEVVGRPRPSDNVFEVVWLWLWQGGSQVRWSNPTSLSRNMMNPHPWAHVGLAQRHQLRHAYAEGLRESAARGHAPVAVPCLTGACMFCGVAEVPRSAAEVVRLGGVSAATAALWHHLVTNPAALGGRGADLVGGHLCPACTKALVSAGAVGLEARGQAVVDHVQGTLSDEKAQRLRGLLANDRAGTLPARAATGQAPNATAWQHLGGVLGRL